MKKTSKEYAKKMLELQKGYPAIDDHELLYKSGFTTGYLKAISENNVEQLIEALRNFVRLYGESFLQDGGIDEVNAIMKAKQALKPHEE